MKKVALIIFLVILVVGIYKGRALYERYMVNTTLNLVLPIPSSYCQKEGDSLPEDEQVREQMCNVEREEIEQLKQIARSSKTYREFIWKSERVLSKNEEKINKILESYKETSSKQEEVAQ